MRKKSLYYLIIVIIFTVIIALLGFLYYNHNNSLKTINIKDVESVKLSPFEGAIHTKEYIYDTKNPKYMEIINNIINYLNEGKSLGTQIGEPVMQGGTPQRLILELLNGISKLLTSQA
jgi:hypothetical protein